MVNILLVLSTVVDNIFFDGKRVVYIEYDYRLYSFYSKRVSVGCRGCMNYCSDNTLGINTAV